MFVLRLWCSYAYYIYEQNNRLFKNLNGRLDIMMFILTLRKHALRTYFPSKRITLFVLRKQTWRTHVVSFDRRWRVHLTQAADGCGFLQARCLRSHPSCEWMKKTRASGGSAADICCEVTVVLDFFKVTVVLLRVQEWIKRHCMVTLRRVFRSITLFSSKRQPCSQSNFRYEWSPFRFNPEFFWVDHSVHTIPIFI